MSNEKSPTELPSKKPTEEEVKKAPVRPLKAAENITETREGIDELYHQVDEQVSAMESQKGAEELLNKLNQQGKVLRELSKENLQSEPPPPYNEIKQLVRRLLDGGADIKDLIQELAKTELGADGAYALMHHVITIGQSHSKETWQKNRDEKIAAQARQNLERARAEKGTFERTLESLNPVDKKVVSTLSNIKQIERSKPKKIRTIGLDSKAKKCEIPLSDDFDDWRVSEQEMKNHEKGVELYSIQHVQSGNGKIRRLLKILHPRLREVFERNKALEDRALYTLNTPKRQLQRAVGPEEYCNPEDISKVLTIWEQASVDIAGVEHILERRELMREKELAAWGNNTEEYEILSKSEDPVAQSLTILIKQISRRLTAIEACFEGAQVEGGQDSEKTTQV